MSVMDSVEAIRHESKRIGDTTAAGLMKAGSAGGYWLGKDVYTLSPGGVILRRLFRDEDRNSERCIGMGCGGVYVLESDWPEFNNISVGAAYIPAGNDALEKITVILDFQIANLPFGSVLLDQLCRVADARDLLIEELVQLRQKNETLALNGIISHNAGTLSATLEPVATLSAGAQSLVHRVSRPSVQIARSNGLEGVWYAGALGGTFVYICQRSSCELLYLGDNGAELRSADLPNEVIEIADGLWYQPLDSDSEAGLYRRYHVPFELDQSSAARNAAYDRLKSLAWAEQQQARRNSMTKDQGLRACLITTDSSDCIPEQSPAQELPSPAKAPGKPVLTFPHPFKRATRRQ